MIVCILAGGLGNQLFQYAAARALALHHGVEVKFYFEDHYKLAERSFALTPFNIPVNFLSKSETINYLPKKKWNRLFRRMVGLPFDGRIHREKKQFVFDEFFFDLPDHIALLGFWQSHRYFSDIEQNLRKDLQFVYPQDRLNRDAADKIRAAAISVSVHLRRGDYTNPASGFKPLNIDYYYEALRELDRRIAGKKTIFVFSDDIHWVQENLKLNCTHHYFSFNSSNDAYQDMRLMSFCDHHIIANSSFSWWGAWLNPSADKVVLMPSIWQASIYTSNTELVVPGWSIIA